MIVVDASVALAGLLAPGESREALRRERLQAPHLIDAEIASGLRRLVRTGRLATERATIALATWRVLGASRHPIAPLLQRIWELRDNVSAYDACYIALAERLDCRLVTADARLARAPGVRGPVTVVSASS